MNDDLISRKALKKAITDATYNFEQIPIRVDKVQEIIDNAPTVERKPFATVTFDREELEKIIYERVIEPIKNGELVIKEKRPTGHWIMEECSLGKTYYCSECYAHPEVCFDFCPYCGADMRKEAEK